MTKTIGNTERDERGLLAALPGNHSRNKGRPTGYADCRTALRKSNSLSVYADVPRRARQYILWHRRGHTRPFTVKAHTGCPFIQGLK